MKEISIHVGQKIRLFRKMKGMTIEVFAGMIGKSKATVSKYENGDISIDVETLFAIAQALEVPVNQLIDYTDEKAADKGEKKHQLTKSRYYMYFYDGRRSRIVRNVIEVQDGGQENGVFEANMYAYLENFDQYYQCKLLYRGVMRRYDTFVNFNLENQNNKVERAFLYAINSFSHSGRMAGLYCGLSTQPILPACFKFVLSPEILEEDEDLKEELMVSKEDIKTLKKMNMFVVNDHA
ncbi:MAG: helix-turn-helix domain-containing protein [Anaerotignum sp.]|nr:helix-turn-helix domain-containing protein [Anaerotignum sp.]MBR2062036.1 helix-turn-helix domain-containing protein [Anaerotignum sp.]